MVNQANWTACLIAAIMAMLVICLNCVPMDENEMILSTVLLAPVATLLTGGYIFMYRGKAHVIARVVFSLLLLLSILVIWAYVYMIELGKGFNH